MASQQAALQRALTIRLHLQISLSAIPMVEEWMDIHLSRWLESVPSPPEMPSGHSAHFAVRLASDLSRLFWGAYGNPAGFIPKMAKYFESCRISSEDVALIDALGNGLEPALVGSWVAVEGGAIQTGWQFCDEHPFADIEAHFGEHEAKETLTAWLSEAGIERFHRFVQTIGESPASTIEFAVPGVAIDDQLAAVSRGFEALVGAPLSEPVEKALANAATPNLVVGVRIAQGRIERVSAIAPGLGNDIVAELCADLGLGFDDKLVRLQGSFGADGPEGVVYSRLRPTAGEGAPAASAAEQVDLIVIPTGSEGKPPDQSN